MRFLLLLAFLLPIHAKAHPVSYKHAIGVMTWNQPFLSDYWLTYSFRPDMAIAGRYMRMDMPDGKFQLYMPQLDWLVKRWNGKEYQANVYAYGGYGGAKMGGRSGSAWLGGVEADAESTKHFIMAKVEYTNPTVGPNFWHYDFRVGIAPYEAEFNEIAAWLMVQYQRHPKLIKHDAVTPLARIFYKSFLFEAGVSLDGEIMTNFMFHF